MPTPAAQRQCPASVHAAQHVRRIACRGIRVVPRELICDSSKAAAGGALRVLLREQLDARARAAHRTEALTALSWRLCAAAQGDEAVDGQLRVQQPCLHACTGRADASARTSMPAKQAHEDAGGVAWCMPCMQQQEPSMHDARTRARTHACARPGGTLCMRAPPRHLLQCNDRRVVGGRGAVLEAPPIWREEVLQVCGGS